MLVEVSELAIGLLQAPAQFDLLRHVDEAGDHTAKITRRGLGHRYRVDSEPPPSTARQHDSHDQSPLRLTGVQCARGRMIVRGPRSAILVDSVPTRVTQGTVQQLAVREPENRRGSPIGIDDSAVCGLQDHAFDQRL
jgi:hypothetical protein